MMCVKCVSNVLMMRVNDAAIQAAPLTRLKADPEGDSVVLKPLGRGIGGKKPPPRRVSADLRAPAD